MSKKLKRNLAGFLVLFVTLAIMAVMVEFVFRKMLFGDSPSFQHLRSAYFYSDHIRHKHEEFFNENYWKLNYRFNPTFNVKKPDSLLGWSGRFHANSREHFERGKVNHRRPVLLYGDSFAMCIDSTDCFHEILNADEEFKQEHYFLNYGVGGYGIDQIYLLFENTVDQFSTPFVVFSMLTTDMDRSMLSVRDSYKPYFEQTKNGLELKGIPIHKTSAQNHEENPPKIFSYVWNRIKSGKANPFPQSTRKERKYIERIKSLNREILLKAFDRLKKLGDNYVVLIFHPDYHPDDSWRLKFLEDLCKAHDIPYITDLNIRKKDLLTKAGAKPLYSIPGDGHPTSYTNKLVADEIKKVVLHDNFDKALILHNQEVFETKVSTFKNAIINDSTWFVGVKKKALERGISVDSMVTLDAIYMAKQEE